MARASRGLAPRCGRRRARRERNAGRTGTRHSAGATERGTRAAHRGGPPRWRRAAWQGAGRGGKRDPPRAGPRGAAGGGRARGRGGRGGPRGSGGGAAGRGAGCRGGRARSTTARSTRGPGRRRGRCQRPSGSGDSEPVGPARAPPPVAPRTAGAEPFRKAARTCDNPGRASVCRKRLGLVHLRARSHELRALASLARKPRRWRASPRGRA